MADVTMRPRRPVRRAGDGAPSVRRVADALVDGLDIHWPSAAALGRTPHERTLTRELRNLAWLSAQAGVAPADPGTPRTAPPGAFEAVLLGAAVMQVLAASAVLLLAGASSAALAVRAAAMLSCASAAVVLLARCRGDVRARSLALVLFLIAALHARPWLDVAAAPVWLRAWWQVLHVGAFIPFATWRLARESYAVARFGAFDTWSRGVLVAALAWSILLASASARADLGPSAATSLERLWLSWQHQEPGGPFPGVLATWAGLSLLAMAIRRRGSAMCGNTARLSAGSWALTVSSVPTAWIVFHAATPIAQWHPSADVPGGLAVAVIGWPWVAAVPLLWMRAPRCPRSPLTALVARTPAVLESMLVLALLVPFAALVARRGEPLARVLSDGAVSASLAIAGALLVLLLACRAHAARAVSRQRLRCRHGSGVADVAADIAQGRTPREIAAALVQHAQDDLETAVAGVLMPSASAWPCIAGTMETLPGDSAIAAVLDAPGPPTYVGRGSRLYRLLPPSDRTWLDANRVEVIARVTQPDGRPLAALLLGGRRDGRLHSRRDMAFIAAAVGTAGVALQALAARQADRRTAPDIDDDELACECSACGSVVATACAGTCPCGGARMLSALPGLVAGKFAVERRLGRGGMGVVYLATDVRLGRRVALKTLPRLMPGAADAMHAEARAMAAVEHPSVAVLYELHVWRDTPVLVVEHLAAGTLADRLSAGPIPVQAALTLAIPLADTLADLHGGGWVHGDVKPSNIGLGRNGAPKLLDFGLTRLVAQARPARTTDETDVDDSGDRCDPPVAGTPLYLPPEVLDGGRLGPHVDVWALSVVLLEMLAGVHPFRAATLRGLRHDVGVTRLRDVRALVPHVPAPLTQLLAQALHPQRSQRIATASEFALALRAARGACASADAPRTRAC